jgi:hypothetical protein
MQELKNGAVILTQGKFRSFDTLIGYVLLGGVTIYWTLFSIWATINTYHHSRLLFMMKPIIKKE